jgi:pimeloyl-ACP methyl ester carboxylesterase
MRRVLLALLVVLAILLAVNTIVTDNETKEAKAEGGGHVLDLPGDDLHVREDGPSGRPAIVMLHGFAGSLHWWRPAAERLADDFRVIRIDFLGHGGSAKPRDGYSMENQARLVARALAELDVQHGVVAGHSMGGAVATALAELDPSLIDGLVLVGSSANKDAGELPFLARLGFVPVIGEAIRRVVTDGQVKDTLNDAFAPGFDVPDQFVEDFNRMTYSSYDGSHHGSDEYNEERAVADRLAALRKPLLAIQGSEDEIVDPDSAQDFRRVRGADVVLVRGTGHAPMLEKPDETARLIRRFTRRVERGPAGEAPERSGSARD